MLLVVMMSSMGQAAAKLPFVGQRVKARAANTRLSPVEGEITWIERDDAKWHPSHNWAPARLNVSMPYREAEKFAVEFKDSLVRPYVAPDPPPALSVLVVIEIEVWYIVEKDCKEKTRCKKKKKRPMRKVVPQQQQQQQVIVVGGTCRHEPLIRPAMNVVFDNTVNVAVSQSRPVVQQSAPRLCPNGCGMHYNPRFCPTSGRLLYR